MLILLPPSESKHSPAAGPRLKADSLSFPALKGTRAKVLTALVDLCAKNSDHAVATLGLGPKQRDLINVNAALRSAHTASAIEIYTGVLYDALDLASLPAAAKKRANSRVAIASALFGLVRPNDSIPAYRLSGDTTLPPLGTLASVWKDAVQQELSATRGPIVDLRSGAYIALGPVPEDAAHRTFVGRVLLEHGGKRSVVSHFNKATKGRLTRAVLEQAKVPKSVDDIPDFFTSLGFLSEVRVPKKSSDPLGLDIVVYKT